MGGLIPSQETFITAFNATSLRWLYYFNMGTRTYKITIPKDDSVSFWARVSNQGWSSCTLFTLGRSRRVKDSGSGERVIVHTRTTESAFEIYIKADSTYLSIYGFLGYRIQKNDIAEVSEIPSDAVLLT